jgi:hypothetical protein
MTLTMLCGDGYTTSFVIPDDALDTGDGYEACLQIALDAIADPSRGSWRPWAATLDVGGVYVARIPGCSPGPFLALA